MIAKGMPKKTFRKIVASRSSKSTIIRIEGTPCYSRSSLDCSCRRESVIPPGRSLAAAWICTGKFRQRRSFTSISSRKPCCQLKRLRKVATLRQTVKPFASLTFAWSHVTLLFSNRFLVSNGSYRYVQRFSRVASNLVTYCARLNFPYHSLLNRSN